VVDQGIARAQAGAQSAARAGAVGLPSFGAISVGKSRYNTGSHVDASGYSFLAGVSTGLDQGKFTLGAFFEAGKGDYTSQNSFANRASVKGKGDTHYFGGGLLGRTNLDQLYFDASLRTGRLESDFSGVLADQYVKYDYEGQYVGTHVGVGYIIPLNTKSSLDVSGKYLWTHQDGDTVRLNTGEQVKFSAVDSQRLRLGARFSSAFNDQVDFYVGGAYEHEYDSKAEASTNGQRIKSPSLDGDTGSVEVGIVFKPSASLPLSVDVGVQGYGGKRQGGTGSVQAKYSF
jgi:outer membrane autotransporter protein